MVLLLETSKDLQVWKDPQELTKFISLPCDEMDYICYHPSGWGSLVPLQVSCSRALLSSLLD